MDSQTYIEYELSDFVSERRLVTDSREEALAYFEKGWLVVERHITITKPSVHTTTRVDVVATWNNNPEFEKD